MNHLARVKLKFPRDREMLLVWSNMYKGISDLQLVVVPEGFF